MTTVSPNHVVSSNVDCVGYHRGVLYVRFKHGGSYAYKKGVLLTQFHALLAAESPGKYLNEVIKPFDMGEKCQADPFTVGISEQPIAA